MKKYASLNDLCEMEEKILEANPRTNPDYAKAKNQYEYALKVREAVMHFAEMIQREEKVISNFLPTLIKRRSKALQGTDKSGATIGN